MRVGPAMLFITFFKTLEGKEVTVELKNDLCVRGLLESVDQYLNLKLGSVSVVDKDRFPQLVRFAAVTRASERGIVFRY